MPTITEGLYRLYSRYYVAGGGDLKETIYYIYLKVNETRQGPASGTVQLINNGVPNQTLIDTYAETLGMGRAPLFFDIVADTVRTAWGGYADSRTRLINNVAALGYTVGAAESSTSFSVDRVYNDNSLTDDYTKIVIAGDFSRTSSNTMPIYARRSQTTGTSNISCMIPLFEYVSSTNTLYYYYITHSSNTSPSAYIYSAATLSSTVLDYFDGLEPWTPPVETTDPYLPDGVDPSGTGGGTGTFSETGDTIGIPGLPTLSAVDTGFITLFNPSAAQVKSLANYMWSNSFDLATFKNIVANPIDCILGLSIVPVSPSSAGSKTVTVGNIATTISLPYLSSQFVEVDCGTLNVQEFWGSYLDYSPYTKMSLYLPYIGIIPLDIDDVMNASISIKYHVDVLSGACVAYVLCNGTQLYTYVGQCSSNVPITSNDFTNTVNGILGIAGSIGKLAADGGASAPTEAAGIASNAINALKPNIQKSGAMSGTGGLMGVQTPYLICQRPRQSVAMRQNEFTGYPANITATLSDLSGYTEIESIHLDGLSATQEEQQEIMDLLTSGVII